MAYCGVAKSCAELEGNPGCGRVGFKPEMQPAVVVAWLTMRAALST